MNGLRSKCKKTSIFGHFGPKRPILDSFWPKWPKRWKLSKKRKRYFFSTAGSKKLENSNERISRKMQETSVFGHFGPKRPILDSFWPKWAKRDFFFKKALGTFLSRLQALTNCKVSEKSNEGIPRKRVTNRRTNERTWFLRSQTTSSRDQKSEIWFSPEFSTTYVRFLYQK